MARHTHWRFALPYLILLVLIFSILTGVIVNRVQQEDKIRWEDQLLNTAHLIAAQAQAAYQPQPNRSDLSELIQTTTQQITAEITFLDANAEILASSLPEGAQPDMGAFAQAQSQGQAAISNRQGITTTTVIADEGNQVLGYITLQSAKATYQHDLRWIFAVGALALLISSAAVIGLALIVQDRSQQSIEKLNIAAQQIQMGNFTNLEYPDSPPPLHAFVETFKDMAERLGTQIDTLTKERAKLSAVLNQMTDGVIIADHEGHVQLLNPAAGRLFQINEKTGLGRSVVEVMRYHQLVELWQEANQGKRQSTMLEIGPQHLFLQVIGIPLEISLPGSTLLLFQDLTQLRRLETVRRDFISNVSHELRTPLASLKALAETLQEGALDDPPAAKRFILRMETEIDNLTQLVNELLELSRIESGKVPLSFHRIQPCDLLRPSYERMVLQAERAGLELHFDCQPDLPAVFADPDRITQVLINLVHNAIKFTPPGGKITLSAYREGEHIVFFVQDTGVGIPKKDLSRIFERFYKADRARAGGGTGLGLSIARHMIESHGGYIWARSEEGVGSTLYFNLPIA